MQGSVSLLFDSARGFPLHLTIDNIYKLLAVLEHKAIQKFGINIHLDQLYYPHSHLST